MARPSKFDRAEAVETVMNEFWRNGVGSSSVKALSERLGITRSSFYNAFGTRDAVFNEAMTCYARNSPDWVLTEASQETPLKPLLTTMFRTIAHVRAADPDGRGCMIVNGVAELSGSDDTIGETLATALLGCLDRNEALIQAAVERGELDRTTDTRATALALQNLMLGMNVLSKVVRDEAELWAMAKTTLQGLNLFDEDTDAQF